MSESSESSESLFNNVISEIRQLSDGELDQQLETAAIQSEKAEMLVCCYLSAVRERRAYQAFGYTSITDYAQARFGFEGRKTRYLVSLGRNIERLPKIQTGTHVPLCTSRPEVYVNSHELVRRDQIA